MLTLISSLAFALDCQASDDACLRANAVRDLVNNVRPGSIGDALPGRRNTGYIRSRLDAVLPLLAGAGCSVDGIDAVTSTRGDFTGVFSNDDGGTGTTTGSFAGDGSFTGTFQGDETGTLGNWGRYVFRTGKLAGLRGSDDAFLAGGLARIHGQRAVAWAVHGICPTGADIATIVVPYLPQAASYANDGCDPMDVDGDGWSECTGDCCETGADCTVPTAVNPGAVEVVGNLVDDDCDPTTSDVTSTPHCVTSHSFSVDGFDLAGAMDLCRLAEDDTWGLIDAELVRADGSAPTQDQLSHMSNLQSAVLTRYGNSNTPWLGPTMVGLSTGNMRTPGEPDYSPPQSGVSGGIDHGHQGQPPASYLAAHGGSLPTDSYCNGACPSSGNGANDAVNLRLTVRVPTNAQHLSYRFRFFSAEYEDAACSIYNDQFLSLYQSSAPGLPADGNLALDWEGNPVSVNSAALEACQPTGCYTCPLGTPALSGTGMESVGAGTDWVTTIAPVVPGEEIVLQLMVFDVSDGGVDSNVLLDAFEWVTVPVGPGE